MQVSFVEIACLVSILMMLFPNANSFVLIFKYKCISVVWTQKHYFIFDSHSKDENGQTCPNGYSTLLKFSTQKSLELHIISYLNKEDVDIFFEAQTAEVIGDVEQLEAKFKRSNDKNNRRRKTNLINQKKNYTKSQL